MVGLSQNGVRAETGATADDIVINVLNVTGGLSGISTVNNGVGATSITVRGIAQGGVSGVDASSSAGQDVAILNQGTIRNTSGQSADLALHASGGVIELTNTGTLVGAVNLSANSSQTVNSGSWNSIGGTSAFTGADDRLRNAGSGVIVGAVSAGSAETTIWSGLEAFQNNGRLQLQDGGTGDVIRTSANTRFFSGSVLAVDIGGLNSADLFDTTGTVTIQPGSHLTLNTVQPLVLHGKYVVVEADAGLTGQFDFQDQFLTAFAGLRDGYTATTAFVEFAQLRALAEAGVTPNQKATAAGADSLPAGNAVKDALLLLTSDAVAARAFDQLSGEIHPSARTAAVEDSRLPRNAVLDRLSDDETGRSVWGRAFGGRGQNDGDLNAAKLKRETGGVLFGVDGVLGGNFTVGVAAGWFDTDLKVNRRASTGSVESIHGLAYIGARFGNWSVKAGAGYGETSTKTQRDVVFPGFSAVTKAEYDGSVTQGFVEAGYRIPLGGGGHIEPFANVTYVQVKTDAFKEVGGPAALSGEAITEDATISSLGLRFETNQMGPFSLRGSTGWRHSSGDLDPTGRHAFAGGATFTVLGAAQSKDAGFANVEAQWRLAPNVIVNVAYDCVIGKDSEDNAITAGFKVVF